MAKIERQVWLVQFDGEQPFVNCYAPTSGGYKTLAGPVTVTFDVPNACPHCGGALPEAQESAKHVVSREFLIDEFGTYKTRDGRVAAVEYHTPNAQFPWTGHIGGKSATWMENGWYFDDEESNEDLVERLS